MQKKTLCFLAALAVFLFSASISMAKESILESLASQGISAEVMDDASLDEVRGTALIYTTTMPSVTYGKRTHHITYSGFGDLGDYTSYNYIGSGYNPGLYSYTYNGVSYAVAGDQWWADWTSDPDEWRLAYASVIEYHYQILDPDDDYSPTNYAFWASAWNRPLGTYSW